jgi:hypothetical protein
MRVRSGPPSEGDRELPAAQAATRPEDQLGPASPGTSHLEEQLGGGRVGESGLERVRRQAAPFPGPLSAYPVQPRNGFATKGGRRQVVGAKPTVRAQNQPGLVRASPDSGQAGVVDRIDPGPHLGPGTTDPPRESQHQHDQDVRHPPRSHRPPRRNRSRHRGPRSWREGGNGSDPVFPQTRRITTTAAIVTPSRRSGNKTGSANSAKSCSGGSLSADTRR